MNEVKLTIFTPTYNRAYVLKNLYYSLMRQTNYNFEWLIVDDGSSDNTESLVSEWMSEKKVKISYFKQSNGGKMRAHNRGVKECKTELFVCVDSDDILVDDAVEIIYNEYNIISKRNIYDNIAGIIAYRGFPSIICEFPEQELCTMFELLEQGFKGDTVLIYKTNILKKHLFPEIPGEKFIGEDYIYNQIDEEYKLYILRKKLVICKYLQDGYTFNWDRLYMSNPIGWALYYDQKAKYYPISKHKLVLIAYYIAFSLIGKKKKMISSSRYPILTIFCLPLGVIHYFRKIKKYKKNDT